MGESRLEMAGLGGSLKLGNEVGPVAGADMGALEKGLGGTREAEADASARSTAEAFSEADGVLAELGGDGLLLLAAEVAGDVDGDCSSLALTLALLVLSSLLAPLSSAFSLAMVVDADADVVVSDAGTGAVAGAVTMGELRDMALERKSV